MVSGWSLWINIVGLACVCYGYILVKVLLGYCRYELIPCYERYDFDPLVICCIIFTRMTKLETSLFWKVQLILVSESCCSSLCLRTYWFGLNHDMDGKLMRHKVLQMFEILILYMKFLWMKHCCYILPTCLLK